MTFVEAIKIAFSNYANFKGRATRSEYWWFYLFTFILNTVLEVATDVMDDPSPFGILIAAAISIALVVPSIALAVRRMHDVDRSGWWLLIAFTIIGIIPVLYWLIKKGTDGPNRFGEDRLAALAATETPNIVT
jgi:uncharacterized membrane protein YhaH (DUF805 family)